MSDMDGSVPTVGTDTGDTITVWPADKIPDAKDISGGLGGGSWGQLDQAQKLWLEAVNAEKAAAAAKVKAEADTKRLAEESARAKAEAAARAKADQEAKRRHAEEGKKISVVSAEAKVREAADNINKAQKSLSDRKRQRDALVIAADIVERSTG